MPNAPAGTIACVAPTKTWIVTFKDCFDLVDIPEKNQNQALGVKCARNKHKVLDRAVSRLNDLKHTAQFVGRKHGYTLLGLPERSCATCYEQTIHGRRLTLIVRQYRWDYIIWASTARARRPPQKILG